MVMSIERGPIKANICPTISINRLKQTRYDKLVAEKAWSCPKSTSLYLLCPIEQNENSTKLEWNFFLFESLDSGYPQIDKFML